METPKTFRVFVSSTFRDLEAERNVLQERVFPALRDLCAERGARFQPIDLRWGVSEEAGLDQQAMNICLGEIARCRETTPRPNFLVLLGNRHGWLALPPQIPADEFKLIRDRVPAGEKRDLLESWYPKDENADPPEHYLRPRAKDGPYATREAWEEPVERRLHAILSAAVKGTELADDPRFVASATEQEILAGALGIGGPEGHAFAFIREITGEHPDPTTASKGDPILDFVDPDQAPLLRLKERLEAEVPVKTYPEGWDHETGRPTDHHLDELARDVQEALERAIVTELEQPSSTELPLVGEHPEMDAEGLAHRAFAAERARVFVGREDALAVINTYLAEQDPQPLVIEGEGGTGKSALLAEALRRTEIDLSGADVVCRFIGATPDSSEGRALLRGLCEELARRAGASATEVPSDYQELVSDFRERLAGSARPLVVFLDSLDQLSASQGARGLAWLPTPLPEGVRLVVSTRPEDTLEALRRRGARVERLEGMSTSDGRELLRRWLEEAGRTLQQGQEDAVVAAFEASGGNPLYLRLAFEEARRWKSDDGTPPDPLATGVEGIVAGNTFERLASEDNHGEALVSHALGYLAASRYGLAEDELLDLLSRDPEVYEWFIRGAQHIPHDLWTLAREHRGTEEWPAEWLEEIRTDDAKLPELRGFLEAVVPRPDGPRLPVVLWSRLAADLRPYLTERGAEEALLTDFFHRELAEVSREVYLGPHDEPRYQGFHRKLADYFRPALDEEGRRRWDDSSLHALGELPYHLTEAGEERWEDLHDTLTDFGFLETKASKVGVQRRTAEDGTEAVTYTGVYLLQDDFDHALRAMSGGEELDRPRIIVTITDFGDGYVVRCPHCNTVHTFTRECEPCKETHALEDWQGQEKTCTNDACKGPLKVNPFLVGGPRQGETMSAQEPPPATQPVAEPPRAAPTGTERAAAPDDLMKRPPRRPGTG